MVLGVDAGEDAELVGGVGVLESSAFVGDEAVFRTVEEFEERCGCAAEDEDVEKDH